MNNPIALTLLSAFGFGVWPIIIRFSGLPPIWTSIMLTTTSAVVVGMGSHFFAPEKTATKAIMLGILAGGLNGLSTITYAALVGNKSWDLSIYLPMISGLMIMTIAIGGIIFFGEAFTLNKCVGIVAILIGIYFLR